MSRKADQFEAVMTSFYLLESVLRKLEEREKDKDFAALLRRAKQFRKTFHKRLALTMRDSLAGMALGEVRWQMSQSYGHMVAEDPHGYLTKPSGGSRNKVYNHLENFSLSDVLKLENHFRNNEWGDSYGGDAWAEIVFRVKKYFEFENIPTIYIDMIANVVHNNGCAFNKGFLLDTAGGSRIKRILDTKFTGNIEEIADDPNEYDSTLVCKTVYDLYEKTRYYIFVKENTIWGSSKFKPCNDFALENVKWSNKSIIEFRDREQEEYPDAECDMCGYYIEDCVCDKYYCNYCGEYYEDTEFCFDCDNCRYCCECEFEDDNDEYLEDRR